MFSIDQWQLHNRRPFINLFLRMAEVPRAAFRLIVDQHHRLAEDLAGVVEARATMERVRAAMHLVDPKGGGNDDGRL